MSASVLTPAVPASAAATVPASAAPAVAVPRLRSVRPDESAHPAPSATPAGPGVYRLPEHVLAGLRLGEQETPLVGYLLLVPAGTVPLTSPAPLTATAPLTSPAPLSATAPLTVTAPVPAPVPATVPAPAPVHPAPAADPGATAEATSAAQGLFLDRELRSARIDGVPLDLTYLEFELLAHLTAHPHRVHTRDRLVEAVWGYYGHVGDGRTVDVHVARLRRKLGPEHRARIVTVRRVGYKYVPGSR